MIGYKVFSICQKNNDDLRFHYNSSFRSRYLHLRTIAERGIQVSKKIYTCFVDYQKAFDQINHEKLKEVMKLAGIPGLEVRLIISLYWNQYATVRIKGEKSQIICIR